MMGLLSSERLTSWAKIVFPLAALLLLCSLFFLAKSPGSVEALAVAVEDEAQGEHISKLRVVGLSEAGSKVQVIAAEAWPVDGVAQMRQVWGEIIEPDALRTTIDALEGTAPLSGGRVDLHGDVVIETSSGYRMETQELQGDITAGTFTSPGLVTGRGPAGRLRAGSMILQTDHGEPQHLLFRNGVYLVYESPKSQGDLP